MAYVIETGTVVPNFLDSAEGLVLQTAAIPQSMGTADGTRTIVKGGTPWPANTAAATGIVYETVDVTHGDAIGSVIIAGRVIADRITIVDAALSALADLGITFVDAKETTRPNTIDED